MLLVKSKEEKLHLQHRPGKHLHPVAPGSSDPRSRPSCALAVGAPQGGAC